MSIPNNSVYNGPKPEPATSQNQLAVIDEAAKPVALVRFTFLDSLKKLVAGGEIATPPAQP